MPPRTRDELQAVLTKAKLGKLAPRLLPLARTAVLLRSAGPARGRSQAGGAPTLAPGTAWPTCSDGRSLGFLLQLDLAEVAPHDVGQLLPDRGLLSFFLIPELVSAAGPVPSRVLYVPEGAQAPREPPAETRPWHFPPEAVAFDHALVLPPEHGLALPRGALAAYRKLRTEQLALPEDQLLCFPTGTHDDDVPPPGEQVLLSVRLPAAMYDGAFSWAYFCIADGALQARQWDRVHVRASLE